MQRIVPLSQPIAVAVSGGADSMALCLLAKDWAVRNSGQITALTVDHGLRAQSAGEARQVAEWIKAHGVSHHLFRWEHVGQPAGNLQAEARKARYRLMGEWCRANGVPMLLTAHHQGDQAETFLLRLARGSGVDGLSAMATRSMRDGIVIARPLLAIPKARLVATLQAMNQPWIEDPSNRSPDFARTRMRALMPKLEAEGLTESRLAATAKSMARARTALEAMTERHLANTVEWTETGARIDMLELLNTEEEIALRSLAAILRHIGNHLYNPRMEELEHLHRHLQQPGAKAVTLAHCLFRPSGKLRERGIWHVQKEAL